MNKSYLTLIALLAVWQSSLSAQSIIQQLVKENTQFFNNDYVSLTKMIATTDGGYLGLYGNHYFQVLGDDEYVVKYSADFEIEWAKAIRCYNDYFYLQDILTLADGTIMLLGDGANDKDIVYRFDNAGNDFTEIRLSHPTLDCNTYSHRLLQHNNRLYLVGGTTADWNVFFCFNPSGEVVWANSYNS